MLKQSNASVMLVIILGIILSNRQQMSSGEVRSSAQRGRQLVVRAVNKRLFEVVDESANRVN